MGGIQAVGENYWDPGGGGELQSNFSVGSGRRRDLWESKPRSLNDSDRRRDFLIDSDTANYFTDNGVLPIYLTIAAIVHIE